MTSFAPFANSLKAESSWDVSDEPGSIVLIAGTRSNASRAVRDRTMNLRYSVNSIVAGVDQVER